MRAFSIGCLLLLGAAATSGCGPASPQPKTVVPSKPPPSILSDEDWGRFRSQRHGLSIPLPEGKTWRIDDHTSQWVDAEHPDTGTRVRMRSWIESKPVSRAHCESEARRFASDLPAVDEGGIIADFVSNEMFAPDFSSHVVVGLGTADPQTEALGGYVLVFGAAARRCVVYWFTAQAQGAKGAAVLGDRLELGTRIAENTIYLTRLPKGPLESIAPPPAHR